MYPERGEAERVLTEPFMGPGLSFTGIGPRGLEDRPIRSLLDADRGEAERVRTKLLMDPGLSFLGIGPRGLEDRP